MLCLASTSVLCLAGTTVLCPVSTSVLCLAGTTVLCLAGSIVLCVVFSHYIDHIVLEHPSPLHAHTRVTRAHMRGGGGL